MKSTPCFSFFFTSLLQLSAFATPVHAAPLTQALVCTEDRSGIAPQPDSLMTIMVGWDAEFSIHNVRIAGGGEGIEWFFGSLNRSNTAHQPTAYRGRIRALSSEKVYRLDLEHSNHDFATGRDAGVRHARLEREGERAVILLCENLPSDLPAANTAMAVNMETECHSAFGGFNIQLDSNEFVARFFHYVGPGGHNRNTRHVRWPEWTGEPIPVTQRMNPDHQIAIEGKGVAILLKRSEHGGYVAHVNVPGGIAGKRVDETAQCR